MSYRYPFIKKKLRKNCPKRFLQMFLPGVLTQSIPDGTGLFNLLIFYQMLNKKSKQHSLLHFLIGKLDQTGFPNPSKAI